MDTKLKRAPGIYLTGFMGSGKTTVARILADRLGWHFADLDTEIEAREHLTIAQIFETAGESGFRLIETEIITKLTRTIERGMPFVVALGGGAFILPENVRLLENHGISIWLDCPLETIERRIAADAVVRPLARDRDAMRKLYEERRTAYGRAHHRVDADSAAEDVVEQILALPIWK